MTLGQSPRELDPHRSARDFFGAELRRWRTDCGLSQQELGRLIHHSGHTISKIEKAQRVPSEALARRCDEVLRANGALVRLWGLVATETKSSKGSSCGHPGTADLIVEAAEESADDAARHSAFIGSEAVEDLNARVVALARGYSTIPTLEGFVAARHALEIARRLRSHTHRTSQLRDLHLVVSQVNGLMSSLAFDLGRLDAAATLARAAALHGEAAGHLSAYAWAEGLLALIANWQGDPARARVHTGRALERLAPGAARLRIQHIAARSHGLQGNLVGLAETLEQAQTDRDASDGQFDDMHDGVSGEFAFGQPRASACAAAAWLDAGDAHHAASCAESALERYRVAAPAERSSSQMGGVSIDLAAAHLLDGDVRGAAEQLRDVLTATPAEPGTALTGRLQRIHTILAGATWRDDRTARELIDALPLTDRFTA